MQRYFRLLLLVGLLVGLASARVTKVQIISRDDVAKGRELGISGAYERIVARVYFAVNPEDPHNDDIVDIIRTPRNAHGEVEFSADLYLLKPKDMRRGNGAILMEIPNRGGKGIARIVQNSDLTADISTDAFIGDGFFFKRGYTLAWLGWQWDVVGDQDALRLYAPVARDANGPIRGLARTDFALPKRAEEVPLGHLIAGRVGGAGYPVADPASPQNVLTVRDSPTGERRTVPRNQWSFPDNTHLRLNGGFEAGKIYELVYVAQDPVVVGLGLAAVRDFLSYEKYEQDAIAPVKRAYAVGISQSGRFLRQFVYQDFNVDEHDRQVLDGMIAHVAGAGRGSFNHRFAQPSRDAQPFNTFFYPTDLFPFTDDRERDPVTNETGGLLDYASSSHSLPKIFHVNTSYEYWSRAASLVHTTADAKSDVEPPPNVRIYHLAGLQHFSNAFPPKRAPVGTDFDAQNLPNANPVRWFWRALITDLNAWVKDGVQPPPSTHPTIGDGTLVPLATWNFPKIPNVNLPRSTTVAYHIDFGSEWPRGVITKEPPGVGRPFPVLVPQTDKDGNDLGGIRLPELDVPLATYTGWNLRSAEIGAPTERVSFIGSTIPFARTKADREKTGDPRMSISERYAGKQDYMRKFTDSANALVKSRFLLEEDVPALVQRGSEEWDWASEPK